MSDATEKEARVEALRSAAAECTRCSLHATRTQVVFGEGNPSSPLVIVGEGPGETEDRTGRPFVGRAGQLLDACLRECGITRRHVFITNVVRCRPTREENGRTLNRAPDEEETRACTIGWLEPTLTAIDPLVILCLGGPSANTIIHRGFRITQERGRFFETPYARYAIASLHPAYILRQQGDDYERSRAHLVQDIEAARLKVIEARKEPPRTLF